MRQINTEELKKLQLGILDFVMKFCDEHGIHCFLDGGTLLGCIRHKGYIPWDDDIDIGMLRQDYDRFLQIFNRESTRYKVYSLENNSEFLYAYSKILDTSTEMYEPDRKTGEKLAVNIDLFPMDNSPDNETAEKRMFACQYIYWCFHKARYLPAFAPPNGSISRKIAAYIARVSMNMIPTFILPKNYFARKLLKNAKRYVDAETKRAGSFLGTHMLSMDRTKLENFTYGEFEGRKYKIPAGYDEWLTKLYGEYMKLPPKKQQITHHHFEAFVKEDGDE